MKKGEDIVRCLSEPRELCKTCYNWLTQEDVGFNDLPQCGDGGHACTRDYLMGYNDTCYRYCSI